MAALNSNNYRVAIVKETTYGAQVKNLVTGAGKLFNDTLEWDYTPLTEEQKKKENNLAKAQDRVKITGKMAPATISGELMDTHEILLQGLFDDTASPYLFAAHMPKQQSYNVYKLYLDNTGAVTHYDVLLGCAFSPMTLTGAANEIVKYSLSIEAADYLQYVANTAGNALTLTDLVVSGTCFLFGNVTGQLAFAETTFNSISLEISKTYVDNTVRFQNSLTKTNDIYTQIGGTFSFVTIWDTVKHSSDQAYLNNGAANAMRIVLANVAKTWTIDLNGVVTAATRPDADRDIYLGNYSLDLTSGATGEAPVTITVASV